MQNKKDIRIENAVVTATGNKVSDEITAELIFDSIFTLMNTSYTISHTEQ